MPPKSLAGDRLSGPGLLQTMEGASKMEGESDSESAYFTSVVPQGRAASVAWDTLRPQEVTLAGEEAIEVWDALIPLMLSEASRRANPVELPWAPSGASFVARDLSFWKLALLSFQNNSRLRLQAEHQRKLDSSVLSVAFSPDGTTLAAGCYNGKIYFMDPTAGEIKSSLKG